MESVHERFLRYVAIDTQSDENSTTFPSTEKQKTLAALLAKELRELGAQNVVMDQWGYVYAEIPASKGSEGKPALGLLAHMDTATGASGANIKPRLISDYDGGDILLNEEQGIYMRPGEFESLRENIGKTLIVTDGTTLLGADDKAGIAEIMTLCQSLLKEGGKHGPLCVAFTPDEEVGQGVDRFNLAQFGAEYAFTVDGGRLGELEYENFNASSAVVTIKGFNIHPGSAKNKMRNACLIAMEFASMLPAHEIPAATDGYDGFQHLCEMEGCEEKAVLKYIIRDHDRHKLEEKKARFEKIAAYLNEKHGDGSVEVELKDSYRNMREKVLPHMHLIENAKKAMEEAGVQPLVEPIRGGTDGARLSFEGLPCPNLCAGGYNYHGRFEYIPVESMEKVVEILKNLVALYA
jgi:tripeptide aminopeptidase